MIPYNLIGLPNPLLSTLATAQSGNTTIPATGLHTTVPMIPMSAMMAARVNSAATLAYQQAAALRSMALTNAAAAAAANAAAVGYPIGLATAVVDDDDDDDDDNHKNKLHIEHDTHYNLQSMLAENILSSDYFKSLYRLKTYHEVIEEIMKYCKHMEPRIQGLSRKPSTAYCILYKFFTQELTERQIQGLLDNDDSPYCRAIGFLYLRYLLPDKKLWSWFEPYLDDPEEFAPGGDGKLKTVGDYAKELITSQKYYTTLLPRIAVPVLRAYKKKLLERQMKNQRDTENEHLRTKLKAGMRVTAEYTSDHKWYTAKVDEILENGNFLITFTEYDDQMEVSIGQIKLDSSHKSRSQSRHQSMSPDSDGGSDSDHNRHRRKHSRHRSSGRSRRRDKSRSRSRSRNRSRSRSHSHSRRRHHRNRDSDRDRRRDGRDGRDRRRRDRGDRDRHRDTRDRGNTRDNTRDRDRDSKRSHYSRSTSTSTSRHRGNNSTRDSSNDDSYEKRLAEMVMQQERENAAAIGRDYARRPTSYKTSLTLPHETGTNRQRSRTPPPKPRRRRDRSPTDGSSAAHGKKKQPSAEYLRKMQELRKKYGDASAGGQK